MNPIILIIDDDEKLNELLIDYLTEYGFKPESVTHPENGLTLLNKRPFDLVILDIMLPDMNGFEVCKQIRKTHSVPIIMLTARGELTDKVIGLELGADDYLSKPFEPRELVARIQSVLRRIKQTVNVTKKEFGRLTVEFEKQTAYLDGEPLDLTTNEFAALKLLVENPGIVLNRDRILETLRGMECDAFNRSVDITMSRLRQKLNDNPKNPDFIKTVWGTGYVFIGQKT